MTDPILPMLQTVRDWLRFAVTRFEAANLVYGHGTASARDDAAFLILTSLHLPPDDLVIWLDAKLTMAERQKLAEVIEARVVTRKPASYLVKSAWIGPYEFYCDERVIVPRSLLGELLLQRLPGALDEDAEPARILDLCTGSGCLAVIAADLWPEATVVGTDASREALAVAARNVAEHGVADRVTLAEGDLLGAVKGEPFDLILCNPPYVTAADVAAFPPEYQAEPTMAHDGGADGLVLVRRVLAEAGAHLTPEGVLVMEVGRTRPALEAAYPDLPFQWFDTDGTEGEVCALRAAALRGSAKAGGRAAAKRKR
jgi:ribosomal protein L3 glutamine methyltransferase